MDPHSEISNLKSEIPVTGWRRFVRSFFAPFAYRANAKQLAFYFRSLGMMLGAGMNIAQAAHTMKDRSSGRILERVSAEIAAAAQRGQPMYLVFARYPGTFPPFVIAMLETGQETGLLEKIFNRLADYFDQIFALQQRYRVETFYPKLLLLGILFVPGLPVLVLEGWKPYLLSVWSVARLLLVAGALLWFIWRLCGATDALRVGIDRLKLLLPWFGSLIRKSALSRWARALSMLMEAGVPIGRAFSAAAWATGNMAMIRSLEAQSRILLEGGGLERAMQASGEFPSMALDIVNMGEKTGDVHTMLDKIAWYYENETGVASQQTAVAVGFLCWAVMAGIIILMVLNFWRGYAGSMGGMLSG